MSADEGVVPWTDEEIERLLERQANPNLHAYTCYEHSDVSLIPTRDGWMCPQVSHMIVQQWAHAQDLGP